MKEINDALANDDLLNKHIYRRMGESYDDIRETLEYDYQVLHDQVDELKEYHIPEEYAKEMVAQKYQDSLKNYGKKRRFRVGITPSQPANIPVNVNLNEEQNEPTHSLFQSLLKANYHSNPFLNVARTFPNNKRIIKNSAENNDSEGSGLHYGGGKKHLVKSTWVNKNWWDKDEPTKPLSRVEENASYQEDLDLLNSSDTPQVKRGLRMSMHDLNSKRLKRKFINQLKAANDKLKSSENKDSDDSKSDEKEKPKELTTSDKLDYIKDRLGDIKIDKIQFEDTNVTKNDVSNVLLNSIDPEDLDINDNEAMDLIDKLKGENKPVDTKSLVHVAIQAELEKNKTSKWKTIGTIISYVTKLIVEVAKVAIEAYIKLHVPAVAALPKASGTKKSKSDCYAGSVASLPDIKKSEIVLSVTKKMLKMFRLI
ncbi:hypothetical protein WA158_006913 [Blastocystis sp. Blastoise]